MDIAAYAAQAAAARPMPTAKPLAPIDGAVVHIDGDYCAYYCAGNDECSTGTARHNLLDRINKAKAVSGATSVIMHLTDPRSTKGERYLAATVKPYQGQRGGSKPKNWGYLREYMEGYEGDAFTPKAWATREADDGIAYVAHAAAKHGKLAVIYTRDKDMRMLPGRHIIWETNQIVDVPFGTYELEGPDGKTYGHKWFWLQMLQGDGADNIPGIPLVGEVKAEAFLAGTRNNSDAVDAVYGQYAKKYGSKGKDAVNRMVEQAALLWLRTDRHAELTNFMEVMPPAPFIIQAAVELRERVADARTQLAGWQ